MPYSAAFTTGALMREETLRIVRQLEDSSLDNIDPDALRANAAKSRRTKTYEIAKRLRSAPRVVWADLEELSPGQQHIVLYYCCMSAYRLVFDFQMELVLQRWRSLEHALTAYDVQRFLEKRATEHPEIDDWTESTRAKVENVLLLMLKEVGILEGERLTAVDAPDSFWQRFLPTGDVWFLEAMLLSQPRRGTIINQTA